MTTPVLSVRDLRVGFKSRQGITQVLHGVSMDIAPGEIVGMVGESGSGKSTTPAAALGLMPRNAIVSGEVQMAGLPVNVARPKDARTDTRGKASVIFQQPMRAFSPYDRLERQITDAIIATVGWLAPWFYPGRLTQTATEQGLVMADGNAKCSAGRAGPGPS